ncbi:MAG: hypothetical protein P8144_06720 [Gammaproteobacteria bacterium]
MNYNTAAHKASPRANSLALTAGWLNSTTPGLRYRMLYHNDAQHLSHTQRQHHKRLTTNHMQAQYKISPRIYASITQARCVHKPCIWGKPAKLAHPT